MVCLSVENIVLIGKYFLPRRGGGGEGGLIEGVYSSFIGYWVAHKGRLESNVLVYKDRLE